MKRPLTRKEIAKSPIQHSLGRQTISAAKIQKWIGVRFERGLSASRRISQLGSPPGGESQYNNKASTYFLLE